MKRPPLTLRTALGLLLLGQSLWEQFKSKPTPPTPHGAPPFDPAKPPQKPEVLPGQSNDDPLRSETIL